MKIIIGLLFCLFSNLVYADTLTIISGNRGNFDVTFSEFADKMGFLKQCNVDIKHYYTSGGGETLQTIVGDNGDIALGIPPANVIGAIQKGAPIRLAGATMTGNDLFWYAKKNSKIESIKDFEGKKIAYSTNGSFSHIITEIMKQKSNINFEPVAGGSSPAIRVGVMTDQFDVGFLSPPNMVDFILSNDIKIVLFSEDFFPERKELNSRTIIINEKALVKLSLIKCWAKGVTESISYFFSNDKAVKEYADMVGFNYQSVLFSRNLLNKEQFQLYKVYGIEQIIKEGIHYKFIKDPFTVNELDKYIVNIGD
jgi:NitT/TauT family transport system substrate-binding protein